MSGAEEEEEVRDREKRQRIQRERCEMLVFERDHVACTICLFCERWTFCAGMDGAREGGVWVGGLYL